MDKFDRYWIGILIGLLLPALFGWLYVDRFHLYEALRAFQFHAGPIVTKLFIVAVFPDMALFFLFYALDTWKLAKGTLAGALPYLVAAAILSI